jgi:MFS transporter, AAHS family, 4-hydroxybenzoate transporter
MSELQSVDVARLIDERRVTAFNIGLIILSFFVISVDGYDIAAISFAAPELIRAWHITDRAALAPVFSASLVGILFGAPIFGFIGDRYGRKAAAISSCLVFGALTWAAVLSTSLTQLLVLRFLAGVGIGGLFPNLIALNAEFAPKRVRATLTIIAISGVPIGGAIPGAVSAFLVPSYGWTILFTIGGALPILMAVLCLFWLPESAKFLVLKEHRRAALVRLLKKLRPDVAIAPDARFVLQDERQFTGFSPRYLFQNGLALITPLVWLLFALNLMGYFFLLSWTPTLLSSAHLPMAMAALATSLFQIGGTIGGLVLCRPLDRAGFKPIAILFLLAAPIIGSIGFVGTLSEPLLMAVVFLGGFCVLGLQTGLNVVTAMIYPTSLRSNGVGWALGVGRLGSIVGPIVGGLLIALPIHQLYLWAAVPFLGGSVTCFAVVKLQTARRRTGELSEAAAQA